MNQYQENEDLESMNGLKNDLNPSSPFNPRIGFIRKVYGVLCCQLLITILFCLAAMYSSSYASFMFSTAGFALLICAVVMTLFIIIALFCFINNARTVPTNYILLFSFTICEAYIVSYSCAVSAREIVFMAAVMTLGITVALTIYAMFTKTDFTYCGGALFIFGMCFLLVGIFLLFTNNAVLHVIYSAIGVCFYGIYLIYDTQLIMGNKAHQLSIDDYILGALLLYLDIILIFLYLLELLNNLRN